MWRCGVTKYLVRIVTRPEFENEEKLPGSPPECEFADFPFESKWRIALTGIAQSQFSHASFCLNDSITAVMPCRQFLFHVTGRTRVHEVLIQKIDGELEFARQKLAGDLTDVLESAPDAGPGTANYRGLPGPTGQLAIDH